MQSQHLEVLQILRTLKPYWARVENNDEPTCFATTSFDLIFEQPEIVNPPQDLSECGDFTLTQDLLI